MQNTSGELLIISGPHGAGKDSVEKRLRQVRADVSRVIRHITRQPSGDEVDGIDYHFISRQTFRGMIDNGEFLEYADYPDVLSGTSHLAVQSALEQTNYASVTLNVEDALPLHDILQSVGIVSRCFFISPVPEGTFTSDASEYIRLLDERMQLRQRPDDRIGNKLAKAALYRQVYLDNPGSFIYVHNADSRIDTAVHFMELQLDQP